MQRPARRILLFTPYKTGSTALFNILGANDYETFFEEQIITDKESIDSVSRLVVKAHCKDGYSLKEKLAIYDTQFDLIITCVRNQLEIFPSGYMQNAFFRASNDFIEYPYRHPGAQPELISPAQVWSDFQNQDWLQFSHLSVKETAHQLNEAFGLDYFSGKFDIERGWQLHELPGNCHLLVIKMELCSYSSFRTIFHEITGEDLTNPVNDRHATENKQLSIARHYQMLKQHLSRSTFYLDKRYYAAQAEVATKFYYNYTSPESIAKILEGNSYRDEGFGEETQQCWPYTDFTNLWYQYHDRIDYKIYDFLNTGLYLRGPLKVQKSEPYFVSIGPAQAFGRGANSPYTDHVSQQIGMPCLNLGIGGIGINYYARNKLLMDVLNQARFVVVNITSPRCINLGLYDSGGSVNFVDYNTGNRVYWHTLFRKILPEQGFSREEIMKAMWDNYFREYREFLSRITRPTYFVNFSSRGSLSSELTEDEFEFEFPQYFSQKEYDCLREIFPLYMENISKNNSSPSLPYYPSQQAHDRTAEIFLDRFGSSLPA